ncbi:hypothetical protein BC832DRAFT_597219 [Gaertneriomyces semiglobifer]|nr:hypothetical protein BC832DRAFT_597219 [Gaertneriomyces semiglobifer]
MHTSNNHTLGPGYPLQSTTRPHPQQQPQVQPQPPPPQQLHQQHQRIIYPPVNYAADTNYNHIPTTTTPSHSPWYSQDTMHVNGGLHQLKKEQHDDAASSQQKSTPAGKKKKATANKRKVSQACVYCRRSHMTCDDGRPCQRCIKRKIANLCRDENKATTNTSQGALPRRRSSKGHSGEDVSDAPQHSPVTSSASAMLVQQSTAVAGLGVDLRDNLPGVPANNDLAPTVAASLTSLDATLATTAAADHSLSSLSTLPAFPPLFASEHTGHELAILSDFLASWDGSIDPNLDPNLMNVDFSDISGGLPNSGHPPMLGSTVSSANSSTESLLTLKGTKLTSTERFLLTAADPKDGPSEDRLHQIINAKIEAGLLKPYDYINGYTRLQRWMDTNMPAHSRQRILNVLGVFRPMFRSVARCLTDYDLVMVEEAFERLLLDYDRVFSAMGIPACLWRRTGEIWKSNKEFAALVGLPIEQLKDGKTCIYELMNEDSAVNYWEKYGNIAFDAGQKAVLTSCVLRNPKARGTSNAPHDDPSASRTTAEDVQCCFSFTIRRDRYNIPLLIAGNFLVTT